MQNLEVIGNGKERKPTEVQKVILAWKAIIGVADGDKGWDRVFFRRYSKPAKDLLDLFGLEQAIECMEYLHDELTNNDRTHTLETIVKLSDTFREKLAKGGR